MSATDQSVFSAARLVALFSIHECASLYGAREEKRQAMMAERAGFEHMLFKLCLRLP
jgi:hypothetical protein